MADYKYNGRIYSSGSGSAAPKNDVKIGGLSVTLTVENLKYIPTKQVYEIDIGEAFIVSTNPQNRSIKIHLSTSKIKKINKELNDQDIDELLDEIETQNDFIHKREQTAIALKLKYLRFLSWTKTTHLSN